MKHLGIVEDMAVFGITHICLGRQLRKELPNPRDLGSRCAIPTNSVTLEELLPSPSLISLLCEMVSYKILYWSLARCK